MRIVADQVAFLRRHLLAPIAECTLAAEGTPRASMMLLVILCDTNRAHQPLLTVPKCIGMRSGRLEPHQ
jgi:hypothetical protein